VPNLGDMTRFEEWDINGTIDILVGGTPCQSFSIAGLRGGLEDGRGNLALTYCQILDRLRPRWFVWENVPGVLSSNGGRDFGSILGAMGELGYGFAYRVLDAQYFGVPQRRRRVFVVGCLGDWRRAAEVLFEPGCLRGDTSKGGKKRKDVTGTLGSRATAGGGLGTDFELAGGLQVSAAITSRPYADNSAEESKLIAYQCHGTNVGEMGTLRKGNGNTAGGVPFVATPFAQNQLGEVRVGDVFNTINTNSNASGRNTPMVHIASTGDISHCLNAGGMGRQDYETETMVVGSYRTAGDGAVYDSGKITAAITTATDPCSNIVAFSSKNDGQDCGELSPTLRAMNHSGSHANAGGQVAVASRIGVRRLTPRECERLQGFPDDYTNVMHRGKPAADGPRSKAIGNSMAVPVMRWIGRRIQNIDLQTTHPSR